MKKTRRLIGLPGFMGQAGDFADLFHELNQKDSSLDCRVFDVLNEAPELVQIPLNDLGPKLVQALNRAQRGWGVEGDGLPTWLCGYSLGGRLTLAIRRTLPRLPEPFLGLYGFVFVSTHSGLTNDSERQVRGHSDQAWAEKFRRQDWTSLMQEWNAQAVFKGGKSEPSRRDREQDRESLALILENWSLARQPLEISPEFWTCEGEESIWVTGERDRKFTDLALSLKKIPIQTVPDAGHRVHIESPAELASVILQTCKGRS